MFTTGSKLFLGATAVTIVAAIVVGGSIGGSTGLMGTVGLVTVAAVFAFLAGINLYTRDGNVSAQQEGALTTSAAAQHTSGRSVWPLVTAVGAAGVVVGTVSHPVVFKVAVVVLLAAVVEWMVQGWSERASADSKFNASVRKRILNPLEFPIFGALVLGVVVYSFSRIMLSANKDAGRWVFIAIAALILAAGFVFAGRKAAKGTALGVTAIAAVALLGVGVVSAVQGQRHIEAHPDMTAAVCLGNATEAQAEEVDHKANQSVSSRSNPAATVVLREDGSLIAFVAGFPNVEYHQIDVPRSLDVRLIFRNQSEEPRRLTAHLGTFAAADGTAGSENATCTTAVEKGGEGFMTLRITKSPLASSTPYRLTVPGVEGQEIKIVAP